MHRLSAGGMACARFLASAKKLAPASTDVNSYFASRESSGADKVGGHRAFSGVQ
jgi:hypothetical protein